MNKKKRFNDYSFPDRTKGASELKEFKQPKKGLHTQGGDCEVHKQRHSGIGNVGYGYAILKPLINKEGEYKGQCGGYHVIAHQDLRLTKEQADEICNSINSCYKKAVNERKALLDALKACYNCLTMDSDMEEDFAPEIKQVKKILDKAGW